MDLKSTIVFVIVYFHCSTTILASDPDPIQDYCIPNPKLGSNRTTHLTILPCKNSLEATTDDFVFSGMKNPGNFTEMGIAAIPVNPTIFPGLNTMSMSFARADIKEGGINPPHFHPRATEVAYVVEGTVYSGFVDSTNKVFAKILDKGEVMVYPRGLLHFQMNVGDKQATIFASFNSQNPGVQKIPSAIFGSGINEELLQKAFGLSRTEVQVIRRRFDPNKAR